MASVECYPVPYKVAGAQPGGCSRVGARMTRSIYSWPEASRPFTPGGLGNFRESRPRMGDADVDTKSVSGTVDTHNAKSGARRRLFCVTDIRQTGCSGESQDCL